MYIDKLEDYVQATFSGNRKNNVSFFKKRLSLPYLSNRCKKVLIYEKTFTDCIAI